jgi:hypothetical protein
MCLRVFSSGGDPVRTRCLRGSKGLGGPPGQISEPGLRRAKALIHPVGGGVFLLSLTDSLSPDLVASLRVCGGIMLAFSRVTLPPRFGLQKTLNPSDRDG